MAATALQQLVDLQRSMYDRALNDARENIGNGSASILKYQKEFEASLPNHFAPSTAKKVLEAIDRHRTVLFGDFHSHKQSQRAFLRILRMYQNRPDHAPVIVALEMFRSKDQSHLDKWFNGKISDQELLESVEYERTWGFPWANFKPILEYCRFNDIKLVGLNTNNGGRDNLNKRDLHAAKILSSIAKTDPKARIFCLIGEFHLADRHLPQAISTLSAESTTPLRIFANLDKYFFAINHSKLHYKDEYLSLNKNTFCVINSPPWMKWHSHSLWEEMRRIGSVRYLEESIASTDGDSSVDDYEDDEAYTDEVLDLDYHLRNLQKQLYSFFKLSPSSESLDRFNAIHEDLDSELHSMSNFSREALLTRVSMDGFVVDYGRRFVYMPEISINNMAAAAGQMMFGSFSKLSDADLSSDELFAAQCLKYTFGCIANKILNPRIPLHNQKVLEAYILSSKGKRLIGQMRQRRHLASATLEVHAWIEKNWQKPKAGTRKLRALPEKFVILDGSTAHELARSLAHVIAEPICSGLVRGKIDSADVAKWLTQDWNAPNCAKSTLASMMALIS